MEVSLSMYPIPGLEAATKTWVSSLSKLGNHLPSGIFLSQTCGLPLVTHQAGQVKVVAIPKYGVRGCQGHRYSSLLVINASSTLTSVSDLHGAKVAVNSFDSLSGHLLLGLTLGRAIYASTIPIYTGCHLASLRKVVTGEVVAAAIDCVTYGLAERHAPHLTMGTKVLTSSPSFPALPYVVSNKLSYGQFKEVQDLLRKAIEDPYLAEARERLGIEGFEFAEDIINENNYKEEIENGFFRITTANDKEEKYNYDTDKILIDTQLVGDKQHLLEAAKVASRVLKMYDGTKKQIDATFPDGRKIRIITTGNQTMFEHEIKNTANIVGFFGKRLRLHEADFEAVAKCWKADEFLVSNFDAKVVETYITCEKEPGGNWYNLVILSPNATAEDFTSNNSIHSQVLKDVAPVYYSLVRIHRGVLDMAGNGEVAFNRTLSVSYKNGRMEGRQVTNW